MESKRMVMFVTMMMIVMVMGNLLNQTEAQPQPQPCHPFKNLMCLGVCLIPVHEAQIPMPSPSSQMVSTNDISHNDYYCKLGCATHHCAPLSSTQNPNVDKVADCVDSCSDKCSTKN
ncbi:thionin-like protein 2 [Capsella rubella]|uniref:thionin-like protein 2 n=1 Tax=Capsella rubella TaxID=81985 RepID=UPI000CD54BA7|nr:thionin-like protein 2 [Capsella rubella]